MTQFDILHAKYEAKAYRVLIKEFRKIFKTIPFDNFSIDHARTILELNVNAERLLPILTKIWLTTGLQYGGLVVKSIQKEEQKRSKPYGLFSEEFQRRILDYANGRGGELIVTLSKTMVNDIMKEWEKIIQGHGTIEDFRKRIEETVKNNHFYGYQSLRIARTETTYAMNGGQYTALETSGVVADYLWITRMDGRERASHIYMNGKKTSENGMFVLQNQVQLRYPGDRDGIGPDKLIASECINCRCTYRYKARRDANGRLIFRD